MSDNVNSPWYKKRKFKVILIFLLILIIFTVVVMVSNYKFLHFYNISPLKGGEVQLTELTPEEAFELDLETTEAVPTDYKKGLMTLDTLILTGDQLFANWLPNDKIYPTVLLDNPQNFQLGVLEMMRYTTRVLRDKLTRLRTTDRIDPDVDEAFSLLSNDPLRWILPSAESRFKKAVEKLSAYRSRLLTGEAEFYPRADNLSELLDQYISLLGGVNTRLANAPNQGRFKRSEDINVEAGNLAQGQLMDTKVPWHLIDDNFYYAQGVAYLTRQMMQAIRYDFAEILAVKNATAQIDNILGVLDQTQFEPIVVLNGDVGSILANHSMELHSLMENARQKIRNLNDMISQ